jgi:transposase, IS30 family
MERGHRLGARGRDEVWSRWRRGESLTEIGKALAKAPASIFAIVRERGGVAPAARKRAERSLQLSEREEISLGMARGESIRSIARRLARAPSTISRELARNERGQYRAAKADERAWRRAQRPKPCRLALEGRLRQWVALRLSQRWSPRQISEALKRRFPDDAVMRVSHETIYRSLFVQARGVLKKELQLALRSQRRVRRAKVATTARQGRGRIVDAVSIRERPAEVEDRAVPGHWEGDLLSGSHNSHIAVLVERATRFTMLIRLSGKDSPTVVEALRKRIQRLPSTLRQTLTWDRGSEMAAHRRFTVATDVAVYFCDPQSPWQRGTNENTNGLLRQYLPKGTDLSSHSQSDLNKIARELNRRPRMTLDYDTPVNRMDRLVAMTG